MASSTVGVPGSTATSQGAFFPVPTTQNSNTGRYNPPHIASVSLFQFFSLSCFRHPTTQLPNIMLVFHSIGGFAALMEGPLSKWTNVMKGWQFRWFVLDENTGLLSYYTVRMTKAFFVQRDKLIRFLGHVCFLENNTPSAKSGKSKSKGEGFNPVKKCWCFSSDKVFLIRSFLCFVF